MKSNVFSQIFFASFSGILDSLKIHSIINFIIDRAITVDLMKCFLVNFVLIIGSQLIFYRIISPLFNNEESTASIIIWAYWHLFWIIPIFILCYLCSTVFIQSIAERTFGILNVKPRMNKKEQIIQFIYSFLVWLIVFLELKFFSYLLPMFLRLAFQYLIMTLSIVSNDRDINIMHHFAKNILELLISIAIVFSHLTGYLLMSVLYGWYSFDSYWSAEGLTADEKFNLVEKYWPYYAGFGFINVIITSSTSFFIGYGTYLALFPFTVILASVSSTTNELEKEYKLPPLRIFKFSQLTASRVIEFIDRKLRASTSIAPSDKNNTSKSSSFDLKKE